MVKQLSLPGMFKGKTEVIKDQEITSKADIFAFGMLIYEMLSLHSPHVDKLCIDDDDDDNDESLDEEVFREALGTRPPLPDFEFDQSYSKVLEIFFAATHEDPDKRPSAGEILEMLADSENDDSIMCVNMVSGDKNNTIELDSTNDTTHDNSRSVICVDDSLSETPSAS